MKYLLFLIAAALLLSEAALRVFDPLGASYLFEMHRYTRMVQSDPRFAYIQRPHLHETFQGVEVTTNGEGLRGPEFALSKPPGTFRVLMLGDSVVFGWGVEYPQTFASLLQASWGRQGVDAEVISAAACSWNTRTEYEFLKAKALAYQPDLVVLVIVDNDTEVKREGYTEIAREKPEKDRLRELWEDLQRNLFRHSRLAANVRLVLERHRGDPGRPSEIERSPGWQDARLALDGIVALCREHGIDLVAYLFHSDQNPSRVGSLPLYEAHLRDLGVPTFSMPDALFSANGAFRNSPTDPHPNARGHALIAAIMERDLEPRIARRRRRMQDAVAAP